jgi:hypothetical protein
MGVVVGDEVLKQEKVHIPLKALKSAKKSRYRPRASPSKVLTHVVPPDALKREVEPVRDRSKTPARLIDGLREDGDDGGLAEEIRLPLDFGEQQPRQVFAGSSAVLRTEIGYLSVPCRSR